MAEKLDRFLLKSHVTPPVIGMSTRESYQKANQLCSLGIAKYQANCRAEAVALWGQALEIAPDFSPAIMNLGAAYRDMGDAGKAVNFFRRAIALRHDFSEAHYNLAFTLHVNGQLREALPSYLAAIRYRPDFAQAHTNLDVLLYENLKNPEIAIASYQELRKHLPEIDQMGPRRLRIEPASACNLRCQVL